MDIPPSDEVVITMSKEGNLSLMLPTCLWFPMVPSYSSGVITGSLGMLPVPGGKATLHPRRYENTVRHICEILNPV